VIVLLAVLAATALRVVPLMTNRFHPDEALYAYFARLIASGHDPMLAGVVVDKPPAAFYLTALSLLAVGPNELAARLPELAAGLASVALLYALGRRLYEPATGSLAAWLLALSPFAILFSITAFVDPLLSAAALWALWAAASGRWRQMALAVAVGFALKQTVLLFVPLCLALALLVAPVPARPMAALRRLLAAAWPLVPALAVSAVLVFGWDALRHASVGFWSQGYSDNIPGRLVRADEVLPRALAIVNLLHYFTASTALNLIFVLCLPVLFVFNRAAPNRAALVDCVLAGYLLLYLAAYWLLAFNVWDRYLLPVLPIWFLLMARVLRVVAYAFQRAAYQWGRRWPARGIGFKRGLGLERCWVRARPIPSAATMVPMTALTARRLTSAPCRPALSSMTTG
jgi:4-amino-4-deoxy-L-arabinose transferase-like glycosyltransferase